MIAYNFRCATFSDGLQQQKENRGMPLADKDWTEDEQLRLEELHKSGMTHSQIGAILGRTRNSIIGRVMRTGLRDKGYREGYRAKPTYAQRSQAQKEYVPRRRIAREKSPKSPLAAALETVAYMEISHPTEMRLIDNIVDLKSNSCRFPIGDPGTESFAYCGNDAIQLLPYCQHHARIAYQPPAVRTKRKEASYGPKV
jgi:GcrA cell cycle regulator